MNPATFASQLVKKTVKIHIALATWRERLSVYGANRTTSECARRLCVAIYNAGIRLSRSLQGTEREAVELVCDIANAGPRHRFTTAASLAHNCGYGAGAPKVRVIAKTQIGIELTEPQSEAVVAKFRSRKFIPDLWKALEAGMKSCAGRTFEVETPNGGSLRYRNVRSLGSLSAVIPRQGRMQRLKFWGGTLTENLVQRVARDVFMDGVLKLTKAGIFPCCRIHDEAVCLFKEDEAATKLAQAIKCMSTQPDWWPELPLRAEGFLTKRYCKG